jgi:hypothetical protein
MSLAIFWRLDHETEFRCENLASKDVPELETELEKLQKEPISALREKRWPKSALSAARRLQFASRGAKKTKPHPGPPCDREASARRAWSNVFELEWPPRSGRHECFPELDRVAWFAPAEARRRVKPAQIPFIDRLITAVAGESLASRTPR